MASLGCRVGLLSPRRRIRDTGGCWMQGDDFAAAAAAAAAVAVLSF